MLLRRAASFAFGVVVVGLAIAACGPSFQVVYEGDARFEHCYAIDDTPTVSMQEKTDCWTQWMKSYRYGQTRNRVDYAAMRAAALQEAHATPTDEAVMGAAPGGGTATNLGVDEPVTTNAFATPPKTMSEGDAGVDSGLPQKKLTTAVSVVTVSTSVSTSGTTSAGSMGATPAEGCTDHCHATWQTCSGACKGAGCKSCDTGYRGCMKKCF